MNIVNREVADISLYASNNITDILATINSVKQICLFNVNGKTIVRFNSACYPVGINKLLAKIKLNEESLVILKWQAMNIETGDTVRYQDVIKVHSMSFEMNADCEGEVQDYKWEIRGSIVI